MSYTEIQEGEHDPYYHAYLVKSGEKDLITALFENKKEVIKIWSSIPVDQAEYRYREGAWTVKQLLQHVNDAERIFAYRACCIARGEKSSLPGFEENEYAEAPLSRNMQLADLIGEFTALRDASIALFKGLPEDTLMSIGIANDSPISVRAIGRILIGHAVHHVEVLQERYAPNWR